MGTWPYLSPFQFSHLASDQRGARWRRLGEPSARRQGGSSSSPLATWERQVVVCWLPPVMIKTLLFTMVTFWYLIVFKVTYWSFFVPECDCNVYWLHRTFLKKNKQQFEQSWVGIRALSKHRYMITWPYMFLTSNSISGKTCAQSKCTYPWWLNCCWAELFTGEPYHFTEYHQGSHTYQQRRRGAEQQFRWKELRGHKMFKKYDWNMMEDVFVIILYNLWWPYIYFFCWLIMKVL